MKKKHRDITVDGITYGWIPREGYARIWKDRKEWFTIYENEGKVFLPSMIADAIKRKLKES